MIPQEKVRYSVELIPNPPMSMTAFWVVGGMIAVPSFVLGLVFSYLGAWPVLGFFGLDVLLVVWALKRSRSIARICERLWLTEDEMIVERYKGEGLVERHNLSREGLTARLDIDKARDLIGALFLRNRTKTLEIGRFLDPQDRHSLFKDLNLALSQPYRGD